MSRIGRQPVPLASGVEVRVEGSRVRVKGPKGQLEREIARHTRIEVSDGRALVHRTSEAREARAMHGLMRSLLSGMVLGVTQGFSRGLEIVGVGYRAEVKGKRLVLSVGFSHPVEMEIPADLEVATETPTRIVVRGIDKQRVGQFAANVRRVRSPEPYKGKGIRYEGELVRRKVGKAAAGG